MLKSTPCKDKSKHTKICGEYSKSVGYNYNSKRAGGIILNKNLDKILLVLNRESVNKNNPKWGLPKGHLKKGENYQECAIREIEEEAGLHVHINPNRYKKINDTIYYYIICSDLIDLIPKDKKEIWSAKWVSLDILEDLEKNRGLRKFNQMKESIINKISKQLVFNKY